MTGSYAMITYDAILLTQKNDTRWSSFLGTNSQVLHGSRYTTEQSLVQKERKKTLALNVNHYYWLFMYMWTNMKHQMHLCGSRELQHIECTTRCCDTTLSDGRHAPEVIFDGSICPSDPG